MQLLKLSHYLAISDPISHGRYRIVYSTRTARRCLLSSTVVDQLLQNDFSELPAATSALLLANEILVDAAQDELAEILSRNTQAIGSITTLYFVIQPTAQCQLGCGYCGQEHTNEYISDAYSLRILERIRERLEKGTYTHLEIGWFGAEPLLGMKQIEKLTLALKTLAQEYRCTYSAKTATNGLSLKKNIFRKLVECHFTSVEITLDGPAHAHDKRRHTKKGYSTFDIIFKNLQDVLQMEDFESSPTQISIRCNVDQENASSVQELIDLLDAHGLLSKLSNFYCAPIHAWGNDAHLQSLEKEAFARRELEWFVQLSGKNKLARLVPGKTKPIVCLSVQPDAEVIDAKGNIFNCTEIPYVPVYEKSAYTLTTLDAAPDATVAPRVFSDWNEEIAQGKFPCHRCRILPICGGACPKAWHEGNSPCPSIKFNIKERLLLDFYRTDKKARSASLPAVSSLAAAVQ